MLERSSYVFFPRFLLFFIPPGVRRSFLMLAIVVITDEVRRAWCTEQPLF